MYKYFEKIGNTDCISLWESKGLSDEIVVPPKTSDNSLALALSYVGNKARVKFDRNYLKQDKIIFTQGKKANIYIVYEISFSARGYDNYPVLANYLFGAVHR